MSRPIIGSNIKLEVQATLGSPVTIDTGISLANPGVVSATAHGFSNGDVVVFSITNGMPELDLQAVRVANKTTDTFECENLDTTGYTAFVANGGTVTKIATFATFDKAQSITAPNPAPTRIDITTLLDKHHKEVFGIPAAIQGVIGALFNPSGTTEALITAATQAGTPLVFRLTYADSRKTILNSYVSSSAGFDLAPDKAGTNSIEFSPQGAQPLTHYAT